MFGITSIIDDIKKVANLTKEYNAQEITPVKYNYRPQNLRQYIGQERAKELVRINAETVKRVKIQEIRIK